MVDEVAEVGLDQVIEAPNLQSLDELLTRSMAKQQIQTLIRGENLLEIVAAISIHALRSGGEETLIAGAILGRLAAVARGREKEVLGRAGTLFTTEPPPIDSLADGDAKAYAAQALSYADGPWLTPYVLRESLSLDTADIARRELLKLALIRSGDVSSWLRSLTGHHAVISTIESEDSRLRRVRRVFQAMLETISDFDGELGSEPGSAIWSMFESTAGKRLSGADQDLLFPALDSAVGMVVRMIELRYSHALQSESYRILLEARKALGAGPWARFIESSSSLPRLRTDLLETAIVLARQNRTDKEILRAMESCWPSTGQLTAALRRHFDGAPDIDPQVADYWLKAGRIPEGDRNVEHRLGNTEDQQIGELLIQLHANRDSMGKLNSAVVPILKTFDACQAATVQRAAGGYLGIAQVAERLARLRKLSKTDMVGEVVEYNPLEHDMEGGHRSGIRRVRVVRDGILKEFGGKKKMLVKPRVEPVE